MVTPVRELKPDNHSLQEVHPSGIGDSGAELLEDARSLWLTGDWDALSAWHVTEYHQNPKRLRIGLLVASALHELSDYDGERDLLRTMLDWGANRRDLLNVMIGQAHASMGRARILNKDYDLAEKHFLACINSIAPNVSAKRHARDRVFKEAVAMGLLPDALGLLEGGVKFLTTQYKETPEIQVLETKLTFLSQQLTQAMQRNQISSSQLIESSTEFGVDSTSIRSRLKEISSAQLGQDIWVAEQTSFKSNGFFVEIGATDGILFSNTWLLEKSLGWKGLCVEPNPDFYGKLKENRSCIVSGDCIAGESGREVEFILADEFGGISAYCQDMHDGRRQAFRDCGKTMTVQTVSLEEFLRKHNAPRTIDYLSLDTEGSEYEILRNFPFSDWNIQLITVEHNYTPLREKIHELLTAKGYRRKEAEWDDWYELINPGM